MNETWILILAGLAGAALGALFFGGLWWTIRKGTSSQRPALWFFGSFLLRTSLTLAGFYEVAGDQWQRLLACLVGFVMARLIILQLTRTAQQPTAWVAEADHAPESG
ncbi:MAG: ATP synthase subunit I [Candidatus Contendobacter sp.]|nr:ATP synthase subunit I [Candidatus Contendobacter sp.]